jgi:predicted RNA-binding protein YlxR (DUF448 family)
MLNLFLDTISMKKLQPPIRMCLSCRTRYPQHSLIRLKEEDKRVVISNGKGRSFYVCSMCATDTKKIKGLAKRLKQELEQFTTLFVTEQKIAL